ncbi:hypothetical protein Pen01_63290 [Phytomonospora endophytica]|nr:hypothetical protein Pen01_63290 [Phytomonospora endophytica]
MRNGHDSIMITIGRDRNDEYLSDPAIRRAGEQNGHGGGHAATPCSVGEDVDYHVFTASSSASA